MQTIEYNVLRGDTLNQIARYYGTSVQSILELNPSLDPCALQVGMTLVLRPRDAFEFAVSDCPFSRGCAGRNPDAFANEYTANSLALTDNGVCSANSR